MRYCALLWTHLSLLLFLIFGSTDLITKAIDCQSSCGNISIPYPFGIGKGCYFDEWFEVQCNNSTSGKHVPYLPKINKEVVSIDPPPSEDDMHDGKSFLQNGQLRIKTNITFTGCSNNNSSSDGKMVGEVLNFTDSPFTIGDENLLVAIGCNNKAVLTNIGSNLVGCMSSCESWIEGGETRCSGYKCCRTNLPVLGAGPDINQDYGRTQKNVYIGEQVMGVSIEDITANQTRSCKVAFLTEGISDFPRNKLTDPQWFHHNRKYVRVQLLWVMPRMNNSFIRSLGCQLYDIHPDKSVNNCKCNHIIKQPYAGDLNFGSCQCSKGYKGNPYFPGGCKDFDECQQGSHGKSNYCSESENCENTPGSYRCVNKRIKILKIIIGLSGGFGMLIFIGISFLLYKIIKRRKDINRKKRYFKRNGGLLLQQHMTSREGNIGKTKVFNSRELEKATENFCSTRVLGQGGQGTVYKGMLVDGSIVAVKKSKIVDEDKLEVFINEVVILSQINHRHIVKLLGCCLETEVPLLVYEYIPNGNLFEHLHNDSDDYTMATWEMRLRIALDIAEALSYLHSAAASPIYHRDIKTTNIMLDEKYRGKVSDFGTSRSVTVDDTHLTTVVSGTLGYLDPEYYQSSQFTDKSDVYSFGVVLVELITGQKPIRTQENESLATYFVYAMKDNKLLDIIDPRIRDGCKLEQVIATARLAKRCLNPSRKRRPNMRAVATELERIRSPNGNSKSHVGIVESEEDEGDVEINIDLESYDKVGVTAPSVLQGNANSTSLSDVEPLFPRQTW